MGSPHPQLNERGTRQRVGRKPSPAQRRVLEAMVAGWSLRSYAGHMDLAPELVLAIDSRLMVPSPVLFVLYKQGWIVVDKVAKKPWYETRWGLTAPGRRVLEGR